MNGIKKVLMVMVGVISIGLSIVCFSMETGKGESFISYGGDAYTGIQNAAAQTSKNTMYLANITKFGFGSILLISGLGFIIASIPNSIESKTAKKSLPTGSHSKVADNLPDF